MIQPEPMHPLEAVLAAAIAVGIAVLLGGLVLLASWIAGKWGGRG